MEGGLKRVHQKELRGIKLLKKINKFNYLARSSWKYIPFNKAFLKLTIQVKRLRFLNFLKNYDPIYSEYAADKIKSLRKNFRKKINHRYLIVSKSILKISTLVHKGSFFKKVYLNKYIVGRRVGEFAFTRKPFKYPIKKKKKNFLRR